MKLTPKIAGLTLAVAVLGGAAATGTALASAPGPTPAPATSSTSQPQPTCPDTDTLQQGDQTSPDAPGQNGACEKAGDEKAGTEQESPGSSDGAGGHADPAGTEQHEATGAE
jgi:hypothetical protein